MKLKDTIKFKASIILPYLLILSLLVVLCIPTNALAEEKTSLGVDVSEFQGDIDFKQLKDAGYHYVYIRAGEGTSFTDPNFKENYTKAREAGLEYGFYYFVTATNKTDAISQARRFASLIVGTDYTLRPAMDFETFGNLSKSEINEVGIAFMKELESLTTLTPILYSDSNNVINTWSAELGKYPLWVAAYEGLTTPKDYTLPANDVWTHWDCYQFTDELRVDGIDGDVDGDVFTSTLLLKDEERKATKTNCITYRVKPGDTLTLIADSFHSSVKAIIALNHLKNPNFIYVNETLKIPTTSKVTSYKDITVKAGDTLAKLAKEYDTTVAILARLNKISNIDLIYVGETLRIPT